MQQVPDPAARPTASPATGEVDYARWFDLSLDLLCVAGLDGYLRRVNPAWTRVLGWSQAELLARPIADFMHPEDRERTLQARSALAAGRPVQNLENRYLCKDGAYRWLSWQSVAMPGESLVFAVARDITERRRLEIEQLVAGKLESAGLLAGGLAHDFNNLLTGLALNVEMIAMSGPTNPEQARHLRQARETVQMAKGLTDQLIALSSRGSPVRAVCDLRHVLQASLELALAGSGVRAECRVAPDLRLVEIDEAQIARVIRGLLLNAREATPTGGTVRLEAENVPAAEGAAAAQPLPGVRIRVVDTGCGISAAVLPKVFDPYFSTKQRGAQKGMGLGLTTCRKIVQEHGGSISIESCPGTGTTVTCHLPAWSAEAMPASA